MPKNLAQLSLLVALILSMPGVASPAPSSNVLEFIALAKSRAKTSEAAEALRTGPPEEFFRWGEGACDWVRKGKADFAATTSNLAEFFGDDLAAAIVFAARKVSCPELK
jgi:hypothetical protein